MKSIGYINLYSSSQFSIKYAHWQDSIYKTKDEAIKYKGKKKTGIHHQLGKVYIEE